jgi:DNA-binding MarR family transcriptional regulator
MKAYLRQVSLGFLDARGYDLRSGVMHERRLQACADRVADECAASRLRALNRLISSLYNEALGPSGLTISQFSILTAIIKMEPVSPSRIGSVLGLEKSTLSRNLKLLLRNRWIERHASGRKLRIAITRAGKQVYGKGVPHWEAAQRKALAILGAEGRRAIEAWLRTAKR